MFTSTHLVRGATLFWHPPLKRSWIYIQASRKGCDAAISCPSVVYYVYIHASPPVRGATRLVIWLIRGYQFTSTHLVRDVTPFGKRPCRMRIVYIHTPRERCDLSEELTNEISMRFTSTHLVRDATSTFPKKYSIIRVSIHASRKGCDAMSTALSIYILVYIHAPRERCDLRRNLQ